MSELKARREKALKRLGHMAATRAAFDKRMQDMAIQRMEEQRQAYMEAQKPKRGGWAGLAATGAGIGTSIMPGWGTAIGAGVGALAGMGSDMSKGASFGEAMSPFGEGGADPSQMAQLGMAGAQAYRGYQADQRMAGLQYPTGQAAQPPGQESVDLSGLKRAMTPAMGSYDPNTYYNIG